ncbi:MAG: transposase [Pseudohongiellaceae bacterium]
MAYDPAILLKIILFAYSKGIVSSRDIQWQCEHNIIFKALSCDAAPHVTSIASFVSSYPDAIEAVFEQVLLVCDQEGLLGKEIFAAVDKKHRIIIDAQAFGEGSEHHTLAPVLEAVADRYFYLSGLWWY